MHHPTDRKEGNVLFNDALNFFYLRLYGVGHMVKDPYRQDDTYHGFRYTSRGALAGTRNSSMGPPRRIDPTTHIHSSFGHASDSPRQGEVK